LTVDPEAGLQLFHTGVPVELVSLVEADAHRQVWLVKSLYVDDPNERIEILRTGVEYPLLD
jgi:hypothetical protein